MSINTSIGWADMTLNPIKGLCQGNCSLPNGEQYCYYSGARGIYQRFKKYLDPTLRLNLSVFDKLPRTPQRIFLVSTNDMFGNWIPDEWKQKIIQQIKLYPQHTFFILTKSFQKDRRFSFLFPHNVWLGISVDKGQIKRIYDFLDWINNLYRPPKIFISFEPLLAIPSKRELHILSDFGWIIIGRLTGWSKKFDPPLQWIKEIIRIGNLYHIPIFLKDNLKEIWQRELIQEIPKNLSR